MYGTYLYIWVSLYQKPYFQKWVWNENLWYGTSKKNIDNVMLLGMAGQIAKKHMNKAEALLQSLIKSQNALLTFQVMTSVSYTFQLWMEDPEWKWY